MECTVDEQRRTKRKQGDQSELESGERSDFFGCGFAGRGRGRGSNSSQGRVR